MRNDSSGAPGKARSRSVFLPAILAVCALAQGLAAQGFTAASPVGPEYVNGGNFAGGQVLIRECGAAALNSSVAAPTLSPGFTLLGSASDAIVPPANWGTLPFMVINDQTIEIISRLWVASNGMTTATFTQYIQRRRDFTPPVPDAGQFEELSSQCSVSITALPTATDDCSGSVTVTATVNGMPFTVPGSFTTQGVRTIVWRFEDASGNFTTANQTVSVIDTNAPMISVTSPVVWTDCAVDPLPGVAMILNATVTDNCDLVVTPTYSDSVVTDVSTPNLKRTIFRTWSAADSAGNGASVLQEIRVFDFGAPSFASAPMIPVTSAAMGTCSAVVNYTLPAAIDACSTPVTVTYANPLHAPGSTFPVGTTTVSVTLTDAEGNVSLPITFDVVVEDDEQPVLSVTSPTVSLTLSGSCSGMLGDIIAEAGVTATDNCPGTITLEQSPLPSEVLLVGQSPILVGVTAIDDAGNSATTTITVHFVSFGAPTTVYVDDNFANPMVGEDPDGMEGGAISFGCDAFSSIQAAIDAVAVGGVVHIAEGSYTGGLSINKHVYLLGAGAATTTISGGGTNQLTASGADANNRLVVTGVTFSGFARAVNVSSNASFLRFDGVTFTGNTDGLHFDNGSSSNDVVVVNCAFSSNTSTGMQVASTGVVTTLVIEDSSFTSNGGFGIYSDQPGTQPAAFTGVNITGLTVDGCTFSQNGSSTNNAAAIYLESLNSATFVDSTFTNNGIANNPRGINFNLKFDDYLGITVERCKFTETRNGSLGENPLPPTAAAFNGFGVNFGARNDGAFYGAHPATLGSVIARENEFSGMRTGIWLSNDVDWETTQVLNNIFAGTLNGLLMYGSDAGSALNSVRENSFVLTGGSAFPGLPGLAVVNYDTGSFPFPGSPYVATPSSVDAQSNWFGTSAGHLVATRVTPGVNVSPWLTNGTDASPLVCGFQPASLTTGSPVLVSLVATGLSCPNATTGSIDATVTGGTGTYTFAWTGGANTEDLTGLGAGTYTLVATDGNGTQGTATVTIANGVDTTPPTITCPTGPILGVTDFGICTATVVVPAPAVLDDCSMEANITVTAARSDSMALNAPFPVGTTVVTFTARDESNNASMCTVSVIVTDTQNPMITDCGAAASAFADASCLAAVPDLAMSVTATDNCGVTSITQSPAIGTLLPLGVHVITIMAMDAAGNIATCSKNFTVTDSTPPSLTAQATATRVLESSCSGTLGNIVSLAAASALDNCAGLVTITQSPASNTPVLFGAAPQLVVLTATDVAGNSSTFEVTVSFQSPGAPSTVYVDQSWAMATVGSDPDGAGPAISFGCDAFATIPAAIAAAQDGGLVSVAAGTYPGGFSVAKRVRIQGAGTGLTLIQGGGPIVISASGLDSSNRLELSALSITGSSSGVRIENGASFLRFSQVRVASHTGDGVLFQNGSVSNDVRFDACVFESNAVGIQLGSTARVVGLVVDGCTFQLNLNFAIYSDLPGIAPMVPYAVSNLDSVSITNCQFLTNGDGSNEPAIYLESISNAVFSDNLFRDNGIATNARGIDFNLKYGSYSSIDILRNRFEDTRGQSNVAGRNGFGVAIKARNDDDMIPPLTYFYAGVPASLSDVTISENQFSGMWTGFWIGNDVDWSTTTVTNNLVRNTWRGMTTYGSDPGSTLVVQNNGFEVLGDLAIFNQDSSLALTNPLYNPAWPYQATPSVVQAAGNWFGTAAGHTIAALNTGDVHRDLDVVFSPWFTVGDGDAMAVGFQPVGIATGTPVVITLDTLSAPVCPGGIDGSVNVNVTGGATPYVYSWSNAATTQDITGLSAGTYTLTVTDVNGTIATFTAVVPNGTDTTDPVARARNISVNLSSMTGMATITATMVDDGSSDNCALASIATWTVSPDSFDCSNVGPNTVTLTVFDAQGRSAQATATVTVVDDTAPIAVAQDVTVSLDAFGMGTLSAAQVNNGSSDLCGIASLSLSRTTFGCADVALSPIPVVLTVTDPSGNSSTATADVTVIDTVAPTAIAQSISVNLDASGNASITPAMVDNGSNDACGIASLALDSSTFNCSNRGANTVVLTVTDVNGIASTASATVTVFDVTAPNFTAVPGDVEFQMASGACDEAFDLFGALSPLPAALDVCDGAVAVTAALRHPRTGLVVATGTYPAMGMPTVPASVTLEGLTYTIEYSAVDTSGNAAVLATSTVRVVSDFVAPLAYPVGAGNGGTPIKVLSAHIGGDVDAMVVGGFTADPVSSSGLDLISVNVGTDMPSVTQDSVTVLFNNGAGEYRDSDGMGGFVQRSIEIANVLDAGFRAIDAAVGRFGASGNTGIAILGRQVNLSGIPTAAQIVILENTGTAFIRHPAISVMPFSSSVSAGELVAPATEDDLVVVGLSVTTVGTPPFTTTTFSPIAEIRANPLTAPVAPVSFFVATDRPVDTVLCDLDGNGINDLALLNRTNVVLFQGTGSGLVRGGSVALSAVADAQEIACGDIDGDGLSDDLVALVRSPSLSVTALVNNNGGTPFAAGNYATSSRTVATSLGTITRNTLAIGDILGDNLESASLLSPPGTPAVNPSFDAVVAFASSARSAVAQLTAFNPAVFGASASTGVFRTITECDVATDPTGILLVDVNPATAFTTIPNLVDQVVADASTRSILVQIALPRALRNVFGTVCRGSGPNPTAFAANPAVPGTVADVSLSGVPAFSAGFLLYSAEAFRGTVATACDLYINPLDFNFFLDAFGGPLVYVADATGTMSQPFVLPPSSVLDLRGFEVVFQWVFEDPTAPLQAGLSQGIHIRIGE